MVAHALHKPRRVIVLPLVRDDEVAAAMCATVCTFTYTQERCLDFRVLGNYLRATSHVAEGRSFDWKTGTISLGQLGFTPNDWDSLLVSVRGDRIQPQWLGEPEYVWPAPARLGNASGSKSAPPTAAAGSIAAAVAESSKVLGMIAQSILGDNPWYSY